MNIFYYKMNSLYLKVDLVVNNSKGEFDVSD